MPRTISSTRFALLELNDDLLRLVFLFSSVDALRALRCVAKRCLKLSDETLRLARWRELPGNTDALRDALWAAGQFTTRLVGASSGDSINEAILQGDTLIASNHSDDIVCFNRKTGRLLWGMQAIEVGKIAVQDKYLVVGFIGISGGPEDSMVQIWDLTNTPDEESDEPLMELATDGYACTGLGWLGPGVLITHTSDDAEVWLQIWRGPEWEETHGASYEMTGGFPEPWENGVSLEVQEKEQRVFTTLTRNAALTRFRHSDETADAIIHRWDPELLGGHDDPGPGPQSYEDHIEPGLHWLCNENKVLAASGDFLAGALSTLPHSGEGAFVKVWKINPTSLDEWCTFPADNHVTFSVLLLGDLLMCSDGEGGNAALAIHSVSQRATLRTVPFPIIALRGAVPAAPQLLGFDETGSTLVFAMEAHMDDSVDVSPEFDEDQRGSAGRTPEVKPKLLVHELSGIW